jgi:hypothetical protein
MAAICSPILPQYEEQCGTNALARDMIKLATIVRPLLLVLLQNDPQYIQQYMQLDQQYVHARELVNFHQVRSYTSKTQMVQPEYSTGWST